MFSIVLALILFTETAFSGSPCPPRENIYPCSCLNIKGQGSSIKTAVQCHRLNDKDSLGAILRSLKSMQIDHFHLYDSFWDAETSINKNKNAKDLPHDWLTSLRSKSIEIVDSSLAPCFACDNKLPCRNIETTRFVAINSTSSSNLCTLCPTGRNNSYPWINCMNNLQELVFIRGKIEFLGADFFPSRLEKLKKLNLSHNEIRIINPRAFQGLDSLIGMDLSHNRITSLDNLFQNAMNLSYLDVSWNKIEKFDAMFFRKLPKLKFLFAKSNYIVQLVENHWKNLPQSLKFIDLENNPLKCHCNLKWVKATFPEKTYLKGYCSSEKNYIKSNLKLTIERILLWCEKRNNTSTIKPKQTRLLYEDKSNVKDVTKRMENIIYI